MVYPSRGIGRVELVDLGTQESEAREIVAHETAITCITLNLQGTRAATASEKVLGSVLNAYIYVRTYVIVSDCGVTNKCSLLSALA